MKSNIRQHLGFTLIELMITVVVVAIGAALALPSFEDMYKRNRAATVANNILATLQYARSEAVTRGQLVRVAPIVAGTNWSQGWQIIADTNGNGAFNAADPAELLKTYEAVSNHSNLTSQLSTITFEPSGELFPVPPNPVQLVLLANQCDGEYRRTISLGASGIMKVLDNKTC